MLDKEFSLVDILSPWEGAGEYDLGLISLDSLENCENMGNPLSDMRSVLNIVCGRNSAFGCEKKDLSSIIKNTFDFLFK